MHNPHVTPSERSNGWCIEAYITNRADKIFLLIEVDEMTHTPQLTQVEQNVEMGYGAGIGAGA